MEKKNIVKRIKDYFKKVQMRMEIMLSLVEGDYRNDVVKQKKLIPPEPVQCEVNTEPETEIAVEFYDQETIDLKLAAIDKIFSMQDSFSKKEFWWVTCQFSF